MIEPLEYKQYLTNEDLLVALRQKVRQADAICIVISEMLERSEFVQAEINEALRGLGRVVFVHDHTTRTPDRFQFRDPGPGKYKVGLVVRHTTVGISSWDDRSCQELAIGILNDPDEGWFNDITEVKSWWFNRDLHAESVLRRYVRECLQVDPRAEGRIIREVIPLMKSWGYPEDPDEMFGWYARTFGRREFLNSIASGACNGMITRYFVPDKDIAQYTDNGWIVTLYLRES